MALTKIPAPDVAPIDPRSGRWDDNYYDVIRQMDNLYPLSPRTINFNTGTSYTFALTDAGAFCDFTNAAAVTVTVPPNSTVPFQIGTVIEVMQGGAGKVTFAIGAGVTIKSVSSFKALSAQEAVGRLIQMSANVWRLSGSLIA